MVQGMHLREEEEGEEEVEKTKMKTRKKKKRKKGNVVLSCLLLFLLLPGLLETPYAFQQGERPTVCRPRRGAEKC